MKSNENSPAWLPENSEILDALREDYSSYGRDELIDLLIGTYTQQELDEAKEEFWGEGEELPDNDTEVEEKLAKEEVPDYSWLNR